VTLFFFPNLAHFLHTFFENLIILEFENGNIFVDVWSGGRNFFSVDIG